MGAAFNKISRTNGLRGAVFGSVLCGITVYLLFQMTGLGYAQRTAFPPTNTDPVRVGRVLSADTLQLQTGEKIRLIGLKSLAPPKQKEADHDENGFIVRKVELTQSLEERAFDFVRELLEGKLVRIEYDINKKDPDFKLQGYVFLVTDNTFANAEILRQGYASLSLAPPNIKYQDALRAAYQEARRERRGLHEEN